jgi:IMP dehydrogenase/GMP reductase
MSKTKFDLSDILIKPETITSIESRFKDINIYYGNGEGRHLPIIAAPMDTVVGDNQGSFIKNKLGYCIPRSCNEHAAFTETEDGQGYPAFESYSLNDFTVIMNGEDGTMPRYVLIDMANGHMKKLYETLDLFTETPHFCKTIIMIGNIANPNTYSYISRNYPWVSAVRIGIGNGNGCLTTQQTGVGYPMGSLIHECSKIQKELGSTVLIVADGGMKDYADIIKALALGAQYVMVGSILNKALESAGETTLFGFKIDQYGTLANLAMKCKLPLYKMFRGMSTKEAQRSFGNSVLKTSEGIVDKRKVKYTLENWVKNFEHYLASAMSYTNSKDLYQFVGNTEFIKVTEQSIRRYSK